jgi:hypothetical protein
MVALRSIHVENDSINYLPSKIIKYCFVFEGKLCHKTLAEFKFDYDIHSNYITLVFNVDSGVPPLQEIIDLVTSANLQ